MGPQQPKGGCRMYPSPFGCGSRQWRLPYVPPLGLDGAHWARWAQVAAPAEQLARVSWGLGAAAVGERHGHHHHVPHPPRVPLPRTHRSCPPANLHAISEMLLEPLGYAPTATSFEPLRYALLFRPTPSAPDISHFAMSEMSVASEGYRP